MEAASNCNYKHIISIRLWNGHVQDEGLRVISNYIMKNRNVEILELLDCEITPLGCEFLNRALIPKQGANLNILKLDHNAFGTEGLEILAENLTKKPTLILLSL